MGVPENLCIKVFSKRHSQEIDFVLNTVKTTVKRPKFGNSPLVRHPLSELLKNHISDGIEVRNLV